MNCVGGERDEKRAKKKPLGIYWRENKATICHKEYSWEGLSRLHHPGDSLCSHHPGALLFPSLAVLVVLYQQRQRHFLKG